MRVEHLTDWQIQEYLDRKRTDSNENVINIENHLKDCYLCRENLDQYNDLSLSLEMCSDIKLSKNFTKKVMRRINYPVIVRVYESYSSIASSIALPVSLIIAMLYLCNFKLLFSKAIISSIQSFYFVKLSWNSISTLLPSMPDLSIYLKPLKNASTSFSGDPQYFWIALLMSLFLIALSMFDRVILNRTKQNI